MPSAFLLLSVAQDFSWIKSRPLLGGGWGVLLAEPVINQDEVGEKESKQGGPDNDPEKVIIPWRGPVDCWVIHSIPPNEKNAPRD